MHMYRVIQSTPRGGDHVIALHGQYEEALDHADRCNVRAAGTDFTYTADADPVMVTVTSID